MWNWLPSFDGQTIASTAIGVVVSLLLFWLGYRKTIGVREERVRIANQDIVSLVVRRLTIEKAEIGAEALERIRNSKSYQYQVPISAVLSPVQIVDQAYTAVTENQFLDKKVKNEIIRNMSESFKAISSFEFRSEAQDTRAERNNFVLADKIALGAGVVGIAVAAVGSKFFTSLFDPSQPAVSQRLELFAVVAMATVLIFAALTVTLRTLRRSKEAQADSGLSKNYQFIREFETVAAIKEEIMTEFGDKVRLLNSRHADIVARSGLRRALIEVKADLENTDLKLLMNRLRAGVDVRPGSRAFVVSDSVDKEYRKLSTSDIYFLTPTELMKELKAYFQEKPSRVRLLAVPKDKKDKEQASTTQKSAGAN